MTNPPGRDRCCRVVRPAWSATQAMLIGGVAQHVQVRARARFGRWVITITTWDMESEWLRRYGEWSATDSFELLRMLCLHTFCLWIKSDWGRAALSRVVDGVLALRGMLLVIETQLENNCAGMFEWLVLHDHGYAHDVSMWLGFCDHWIVKRLRQSDLKRIKSNLKTWT